MHGRLRRPQGTGTYTERKTTPDPRKHPRPPLNERQQAEVTRLFAAGIVFDCLTILEMRPTDDNVSEAVFFLCDAVCLDYKYDPTRGITYDQWVKMYVRSRLWAFKRSQNTRRKRFATGIIHKDLELTEVPCLDFIDQPDVLALGEGKMPRSGNSYHVRRIQEKVREQCFG